MLMFYTDPTPTTKQIGTLSQKYHKKISGVLSPSVIFEDHFSHTNESYQKKKTQPHSNLLCLNNSYRMSIHQRALMGLATVTALRPLGSQCQMKTSLYPKLRCSVKSLHMYFILPITHDTNYSPDFN